MFRDFRPIWVMTALFCAAISLAYPAFALQPTAGFSDAASSMQQGSMQQAPEFADIYRWINSPPLTMQRLRGKVVLIDFWAYSCINCLRTLPHVTHWYDTYKDRGFMVVGVHAPEFEFEKDPANVERAVKQFGIYYPVAMDNDRQTWAAWHNQYWPEEYLVNRAGEVVATHIGEGGYAEMENAIRRHLDLSALASVADANANLAKIGSPEMDFGLYFRLENLANPADDPKQINDYRAPESLPLNRFALQGRWRIDEMYAALSGPKGEIRLHFHAGKVYMVASSPSPITLSITVDGKPQSPVTVQASKMYALFDSGDYADHQITIDIPKPGLHAFTFTFG